MDSLTMLSMDSLTMLSMDLLTLLSMESLTLLLMDSSTLLLSLSSTPLLWNSSAMIWLIVNCRVVSELQPDRLLENYQRVCTIHCTIKYNQELVFRDLCRLS